MRDFIDTVAVTVVGSLLVLGLCAVYWIARLFGVDLGEDV